MGTAENISEYLYSHKAAATKQYMERSLSDVFRLMFNLDLALAQSPSPDRDEDAISVYVLLSHEKTTACVSLRILKSTALMVAERAGVNTMTASSSFILEDVACELVNIVANNLRTFLSENTGAYFSMGEVMVAKADLEAIRPSIVLNLDFPITPEALLNLGFTCGEGAAKK